MIYHKNWMVNYLRTAYRSDQRRGTQRKKVKVILRTSFNLIYKNHKLFMVSHFRK